MKNIKRLTTAAIIVMTSVTLATMFITLRNIRQIKIQTLIREELMLEDEIAKMDKVIATSKDDKDLIRRRSNELERLEIVQKKLQPYLKNTQEIEELEDAE